MNDKEIQENLDDLAMFEWFDDDLRIESIEENKCQK